jgi:hypothetical protein
MKWYSVKNYRPPMEVICLIFTENNYFYLGRLIDNEDFSIWATDSECDECGSQVMTVAGVTHFCILEPVKMCIIKKQFD